MGRPIMADANSIVAVLSDADGTRRDIAIHAARQIEGLFNALRGCAIPSVLANKDPIHVTAVRRALALRGEVLTRAIVRSVGDASASPEDLQDIVDCE